MNIDRIQVTIQELIDGYEEKGPDGIEGVVAYGGRLDVRPAYQREYIYPDKDRDEVIRSVKKKFPINVMYWAKTADGRYELMDGQQRTISICRYAAVRDEADRQSYEQCFSVDNLYFFNLPEDQKQSIRDYVLDIYVCDGTPSEVLDWFKIINIAGKVLSPQELRNTSIRQEYLETAIEWIAARDGLESIEEYMALHQQDENANQIWIYFRRVIEWVEAIFPEKRKEVKGIEWGLLYNRFKDAELDPDALERQVKALLIDDEVTNKKGVYTYVLTGEEKYLSLRAFTTAQKREAYERQGGICPDCQAAGKAKVHYDFDEMEADHITPWSRGGRTVPENCKMRCRECNRRKSDI